MTSATVTSSISPQFVAHFLFIGPQKSKFTFKVEPSVINPAFFEVTSGFVEGMSINETAFASLESSHHDCCEGECSAAWPTDTTNRLNPGSLSVLNVTLYGQLQQAGNVTVSIEYGIVSFPIASFLIGGQIVVAGVDPERFVWPVEGTSSGPSVTVTGSGFLPSTSSECIWTFPVASNVSSSTTTLSLVAGGQTLAGGQAACVLPLSSIQSIGPTTATLSLSLDGGATSVAVGSISAVGPCVYVSPTVPLGQIDAAKTSPVGTVTGTEQDAARQNLRSFAPTYALDWSASDWRWTPYATGPNINQCNSNSTGVQFTSAISHDGTVRISGLFLLSPCAPSELHLRFSNSTVNGNDACLFEFALTFVPGPPSSATWKNPPPDTYEVPVGFRTQPSSLILDSAGNVVGTGGLCLLRVLSTVPLSLQNSTFQPNTAPISSGECAWTSLLFFPSHEANNVTVEMAVAQDLSTSDAGSFQVTHTFTLYNCTVEYLAWSYVRPNDWPVLDSLTPDYLNYGEPTRELTLRGWDFSFPSPTCSAVAESNLNAIEILQCKFTYANWTCMMPATEISRCEVTCFPPSFITDNPCSFDPIVMLETARVSVCVVKGACNGCNTPLTLHITNDIPSSLKHAPSSGPIPNAANSVNGSLTAVWLYAVDKAGNDLSDRNTPNWTVGQYYQPAGSMPHTLFCRARSPRCVHSIDQPVGLLHMRASETE